MCYILCGQRCPFLSAVICPIYPKSGIAGSYGNHGFNLLRTCQAIFQSNCPTLHSHQLYSECFNFSTTSPTVVIASFIIVMLMVWGGDSLWCGLYFLDSHKFLILLYLSPFSFYDYVYVYVKTPFSIYTSKDFFSLFSSSSLIV